VFLSTFPDFANDVVSAINFLKNRSEVNASQIGLCGHSEGAFIAPLCASTSKDVAFIILISGGGHSGERLFLSQSELIMRADGESEDKINDILISQKKMLKLIREEAEEKVIESILIDITKKSMNIKTDVEKVGKEELDATIKNQVTCQLEQFNSPWFKYFLDYDPLPKLEKVKCPVLLLFGELDLQVPTELNKDAMVGALKKGGNKNYSPKIFPKANHLYQRAETGSPSEYGKLAKEFVPGLLDFMSDWLVKQVTIVK
jgi:pimeloyl-ACP methyl ester carboxylesterase